ncbi:hypothetical protein ACJIZ3_013628 [Penstemon smallii]|uniref:Uncharacterized protein n=1 Tax=Penstemon smallii TaxID=265156 RepID=A0ABD3RH48_9LAMI
MSHNWEKLVGAVLLREELREIALSYSMATNSRISDGEETSSNHNTFSSSCSSIRDDPSPQKIQLPVDYSDLMVNHTNWKSMLPLNKNEIVWRSASLSFSRDKWRGKNCFMIGAAGLLGNAECVYYRKSRFSEVAKLNGLVDIRCEIENQRLSPNTVYGAYLVFRFAKLSHDSNRVDIFDGSNVDVRSCERALESAIATIRFVVDDETDFDEEVDHTEQRRTRCKLKVVSREDGWKEIEMGELYIDDEKQSGKVEARFETDKLHGSKICPIVEGIEFRPIVGSTDFIRPYEDKISRLLGNFVRETRNKEGRNLGVEVMEKSETEKILKNKFYYL